MTETKIVKVTKKENHLLLGEAEGMEWKVVAKPFSSVEVSVGDYVHCYILHDEESEEFYLEQIPGKPLTSEAEWKEQEEESY
jgi:hypothetical protein